MCRCVWVLVCKKGLDVWVMVESRCGMGGCLGLCIGFGFGFGNIIFTDSEFRCLFI